MKSLLTGIVVGAIAISAINNKSKSFMKKSKKAIVRKFEDILNV